MNPNSQAHASLSNGAHTSDQSWRAPPPPPSTTQNSFATRNSSAQMNNRTNNAGANNAPTAHLTNNHLPAGAPLNDLVSQLEDYHPTIPDAVTSYYINRLVLAKRGRKTSGTDSCAAIPLLPPPLLLFLFLLYLFLLLLLLLDPSPQPTYFPSTRANKSLSTLLGVGGFF